MFRSPWQILTLIVLLQSVVDAQTISSRRFASNIVIPQSRAWSLDARGTVEITGVTVGVVIRDQAATTTMDVSLRNRGRRRLEAEVVLPVPPKAVVRGFTFEGTASEPSAILLPKDEARKTYDAIVAKTRDPALLEFVGYQLIRTSVFPVPAGGTQKVRITYEHLLPADGDRIDYLLPRSEAIGYHVPWNVSVRIESKTGISTVYSPSHKLETRRTGAKRVSVKIADSATREPGSFRLSYLIEKGSVTATLFAYPDPKLDGGYFLLLAGLPSDPALAKSGQKREVTLVIDRSGSMNGEKIEQVREAALQVIAGLDSGESFNILTYNDSVHQFAPNPVLNNRKNAKEARQFIQRLKASGGTNLHDALLESLRQKPTPGSLPIVLFLTDGLPTVGQTSELAIRNLALKANPHHRRIFTFGVGVDVNTPLLEKVASVSRAKATFILPGEDVEVKVGQVFRRLKGPILADTTLAVVDEQGKSAPRRMSDVLPAQLPDLFQGDQLVLLGQYHGNQPLEFRLGGNYLGKPKTFRFQFKLDTASTRNAFVARLWASRKIAQLIDEIRQSGANGSPFVLVEKSKTDPKLKELTEEILRLTTEFGILTEYTAFLAREGSDLSKRDDVLSQAISNFDNRARQVRTGLASVNQSLNNDAQANQINLNPRNGFFDAKMNRVSISTVQQVNDRAYFRRNNRWVDGRLIDRGAIPKPRKVIEFGSPQFQQLLQRLIDEGRQGSISLSGDILLLIDGEAVLVKNGSAKPKSQPAN